MIKVDLHSHILPGMDDGAKETNISLDLLKMEAEQGIEHIVLTPHFHLRNESIADFSERRKKSFEKLLTSISGTALDGVFDFRLGAEVRYDPSLTEEKDLESLCISGTNVLLIEFSASVLRECAVRYTMFITIGVPPGHQLINNRLFLLFHAAKIMFFLVFSITFAPAFFYHVMI